MSNKEEVLSIFFVIEIIREIDIKKIINSKKAILVTLNSKNSKLHKTLRIKFIPNTRIIFFLFFCLCFLFFIFEIFIHEIYKDIAISKKIIFHTIGNQ